MRTTWTHCLAIGALLLCGAANAGEKWILNDNFPGSGSVSTQVLFGTGEGAGVLLTPEQGDYPLKIIAIDVMVASITPGGSGAIGPYVLDVWDETSGVIAPPATKNGNLHTGGVALTASTTMFNRFTFPSPLTVTSGKLFIGLKPQTDSLTDGVTLGMDSGPVVPGGNYFYNFGTWYPMTGSGSGAAGVNRNWIIRAVLDIPTVAPVVFAIDPSTADNGSPTQVTITGENFTMGSRAFIGTVEITVTSQLPTQLTATVPAGITPGVYDVTVENPGPVSGTLNDGFTVTGPPPADAGTGSDAGTMTDAGTQPEPDAGTPDAGVSPDALVLESVSPSEVWSADGAQLLLLGANFDPDAQVLIGDELLDEIERKSGSVINAHLPAGFLVGTYDVTVINSDGRRATLPDAVTVVQGTGVQTGCGCGAGGGGALSFLLLGAIVLVTRSLFRPRERTPPVP